MSNVEQLDIELDALIGEMEAALDEYEKGLEHLSQVGNVHNTSKYDLDLSHIHNMSLATGLEVLARSENKYHPDGGTYLLLERVAITPLRAHMADRNNPHGTTLEQADMYSVSQIQDLFSDKLLRTSPAYDSALLGGQDRNALINQTKTNLDASNIAEGVIPPARFASSTPFALFSGEGRFSNNLAPSNVVANFMEDGKKVTKDGRLWHTVPSPARVTLEYEESDHSHSITDPEKRDIYGADITLSSASTSDEWIGFVIAELNDKAGLHQVVVRVKPALHTDGQVEICLIEGEDEVVLTSMDHDIGNNKRDGWSDKSIRMRVERMGDLVRVTLSEWNSAALNVNLMLSIDLSSIESSKSNVAFNSPASIGYYGKARSMATFANTTFSVVSNDDYALTGANSFVHMLTALLGSGGSTGNFHLMGGTHSTVTACWNAMVGANVPIGTYLIGHYRRAFNWRRDGWGVSQTHYMFHMVAGRRNQNGSTTRIF